jgi:predicted dienelactone hydrolase
MPQTKTNFYIHLQLPAYKRGKVFTNFNCNKTMRLFSSKISVCIVAVLVLQSCGNGNKITKAGNDTFIAGDALPDAPILSARGEYKVGVRTLDLINKNQVDILHSKAGADPLYDRPLKVEIWYPAIIPDGKKERVTYEATLGMFKDSTRPLIPYTFNGRALRNAAPDLSAGKFPLIIVSHGYPGSRLLLTYLTENLASKGYVVVAIAHTESTYSDRAAFQSTLLNRSKDVLFILNEIAALSNKESNSFLTGLADTDNTALIGYSMGGYGVLNVAGAGYSGKLDTVFGQMTGGSSAIKVRTTNDSAYKSSVDARIKAVVAFAPWGMQRGVWDAAGLAGLKVPTFFVAGSLDDVSGYEDGIKAIYNGAVNTSRYLLTYVNARHNVAPNPPPPETLKPGVNFDEYYHYAEPSWDSHRINNINQHFVTAFIGMYLKQKDFVKYLDVQEKSNQKTWAGFKPRTATGLELLHATAR